MRPMKDINIGDIYCRPGWTVDWVVTDKSDKEKMVQIESVVCNNKKTSIWKKNTDSIFRYRVFEGYHG